MQHLDAERYRQILEQPQTVTGEVIQHLRSDCAECAAFLASLPPGERDRRIDALLREPDAAPLAPFSLTAGDGRGPKVSTAILGIVGLVAIAGATEAYFIHRTTIGPREVMYNAPPVEMLVTVRHRDGTEGPALPNAQLSLDDHLHVEAVLARNAYVSLVRSGDNAGFEPIALNQFARTSTVEFEADGGAADVSLENLNGSQHLLVLTCDRPIAIDEAISAAKQTLPAGLGMATYPFQVSRERSH